jgi:2-oxoglutarate dehydrogenase complex dehydrogenase (E1) component-like enzyme
VNATEFVWFQEEHRNSGAWNYLAPRIDIALGELKKDGLLKNYNLSCVSRRNAASPAVGKKKKHDEEQA